MTHPNSEDKIIFQQLIQPWQLSEYSLTSLIGQHTAVKDKSAQILESINNQIKEKLLTIKVCCNDENECQTLPKLIKERAYYLAVYLTNSTDMALVNHCDEEICEALSKLNIQNPEQLYYYLAEIDYQQHLYNYYQKSSNILLYVGAWNSRKNIKIGEYLIEALQLDKNTISPEKLLDLLEDPLHEIVKEFRDNGLEVSPIKSDQENTNLSDNDLWDKDEIEEDEEDWDEEESEANYYQDHNDYDDDYYYSSPDPFDGVDWGDPSTFNQAAWDQFRDD
ncbi:hypothetical protein [Geminocystis sp. NIES-3709]|uniref:hypothetical protein n=1 Tax=Geminocystis sp. NIES-3709 TaxID=1617448 RepID=UPI0005FC87CD|nr:hypothetical protein [Geminocystis sp. NIES-3709]BAQ66986.1 hypothetical protein GM3709_3751 [Geminocystis sp. NIES-3709]